MMAQTLRRAPPDIPDDGPVKKGRTNVPTQELSEQTQHLLLVRDQRDKTAFAALFDYFAPRLKGMFMRNGCGAAQAEEILQEVMLTVWRKAAQFDPHRAQASAWIYQIARNRHIDLIRKAKRHMPEELESEADSEPDAAHILALQQEAGQLRDAIARLSDNQREVIERAYLGELSHQEISSATGLPLGTIKSRIRLGLERLRHELKGLR